MGTGTQDSTHEVAVPCTIDDEIVTYKATVLENSDIPAILGMKSMQKMNSVIDTRHKRLICLDDPRDCVITLKNTAKVYQLQQAPGGYLMLPCSPGSTSVCRPNEYVFVDKVMQPN